MSKILTTTTYGVRHAVRGYVENVNENASGVSAASVETKCGAAFSAVSAPIVLDRVWSLNVDCPECLHVLEAGEADEDGTVIVSGPPVVSGLRREPGTAGSLSVSGTVTYPGEAGRAFAFSGSVYGGPVAYTFEMHSGYLTSGFVTEPDRFGFPFHTDPARWVAAFYA